ncbi:MAG: relaxase/mobilization nuclease domain-containing protein [Mangrovicoccus sp.]
MILKGSQRSGAKALAVHLLNREDNDHIEVHDLRGFLSDDLTEAFKEIQAIAKGTRCQKPLFSLSLNPPPGATPTSAQFVAAADKAEEALGLNGQPRAIVFHEKDGRRHAHIVWSRIDAATMTARPMSHFKTKLQSVARQLYLEHGWKLPRGFLDKSARSPLNANLAEWQAAKQRGRNALDQKLVIQSCWAASDDRVSFEAALADYGLRLARGDRRNHVLASYDGQVLAVARNTGKRAKEVTARLGNASELPSVAEALAAHRSDVRRHFGRLAGEMRKGLMEERAQLSRERKAMIAAHRTDRDELDTRLTKARSEAERVRRGRIKTGLSGLWQRLTGARRRILKQNAAESEEAARRDDAQRHAQRVGHLNERLALEIKRTHLRREALGLVQELRADRDTFLAALDGNKIDGKRAPSSRRQSPRQGPEL